MANPFIYLRKAIVGGVKLEDALTKAAEIYEVDAVIHKADAGGTADAITATMTPTVDSLDDNTLCIVEASGANTVTTPTFAPDGLTAKTITKLGNQALAVGDIYGAGHRIILQYDSGNDVWELLNPA